MLRPGSVRKAQVAVIPDIILCDRHKEKVTIFCSICQDLMCAECIVDKHNGHNFKRVKEIVGEKRQELTTKLSNLETIKVPEIKKLLDETRVKKSQTETNNKELMDSINNRADELVAEVNNARNKLLEEVNRLYICDSDKLMKLENTLEELLIEKEGIAAQYKKDLMSNNDVKIVKINLELGKKSDINQNELSTDIHCVKKYVFLPGNTESLRYVFGRCIEQREDPGTENSASSDHVIETKLEVLSEFQHETDKDDIRAITTIDDQAWIATHDRTDIKQVDKSGQVHKTLTFNTNISDLAVTDDGCLLVTPNGGSGEHRYQIKNVKRNGVILS